jgi:ABC-type transporter Mla subunit MlaD
MKAICKNMGWDFAGALLRPHGPVFKTMADRGTPVNDILQAAKDAGRQLVTDGAILPQTLATIGRPLMSLEDFIKRANQRQEHTAKDSADSTSTT